MAIEKCPKCGEEYDTLYVSFGHSCKKEKHFGWINIFIFSAFLNGLVNIALSLFVILAYFESREIHSLFLIKNLLVVIISVLQIVVAAGLLKRKKWGIYLTYTWLAFSFLGIIFALDDNKAAEGVISSFFYCLWFIYLYKNKDWFK